MVLLVNYTLYVPTTADRALGFDLVFVVRVACTYLINLALLLLLLLLLLFLASVFSDFFPIAAATSQYVGS